MNWKKYSSQTKIFSFLILFALASNLSSDIEDNIALHKEQFSEVALKIWEYAELGYQETKSSNLLASELEKEGFKITKGVAGIPTAFVAEFGSSGPVIGILGEFDALPGLAQTNSPFKE
ncbi:MAG: amidohydrolase, partial [Gammaproteobacteria bacterium]